VTGLRQNVQIYDTARYTIAIIAGAHLCPPPRYSVLTCLYFDLSKVFTQEQMRLHCPKERDFRARERSGEIRIFRYGALQSSLGSPNMKELRR